MDDDEFDEDEDDEDEEEDEAEEDNAGGGIKIHLFVGKEPKS